MNDGALFATSLTTLIVSELESEKDCQKIEFVGNQRF